MTNKAVGKVCFFMTHLGKNENPFFRKSIPEAQNLLNFNVKTLLLSEQW